MNDHPIFPSKEFFDAFRSESDRACAVLAGTLLETLLEQLLRRKMITEAPSSLFDYPGPFSALAARIRTAYALGLLSKGEMQELERIRKIRNSFAHELDHSLSFSLPPISDQARDFEYPLTLIEVHDKTPAKLTLEEAALLRDSPRRRFEVATGLLAGLIRMKLDIVEQPSSITGWMDAARRLKDEHV